MKTNPHQSANRPCNSNDLITVSEGVQCSNCLALVIDHRQDNPEYALVYLVSAATGKGLGVCIVEWTDQKIPFVETHIVLKCIHHGLIDNKDTNPHKYHTDYQFGWLVKSDLETLNLKPNRFYRMDEVEQLESQFKQYLTF